MLITFCEQRALLVPTGCPLVSMGVLMAMSPMVVLFWAIVWGFIVRMIAIHNMRWDVVVHHPRDELDTDDTS